MAAHWARCCWKLVEIPGLLDLFSVEVRMKWMTNLQRQQEGFADPPGSVGKPPEAAAPDPEVCVAAHSARKGGSSVLGELMGFLLLQKPLSFGSRTRFVL